MKDILVRVSALAVISAPLCVGVSRSLRAQTIKLTCKQSIFIGKLASAACSAKYIISPDGAHSDTGCLAILNNAAEGSCTLKVTGGPATKSAFVSFTNTAFTLSSTMGGNTVVMNNLRVKNRTQTPIASKITLKTTTLAATKVTLDIGGSLNYANGQPAGNYVGKVAVRANF